MSYHRVGVAVISITMSFLTAPLSTHADTISEHCGRASPTATGTYFSPYESSAYSAAGYLIYHFQNQSGASRSFRLATLLYDDECTPSSWPPSQAGWGGYPVITLPDGVTDWSVRFTSISHYDVWDDHHGTIIASSDIPPFPAYTSVAFEGFLDNDNITFTRGLKIQRDGMPPIAANHVENTFSCPSIAGFGTNQYYFDPSYERAEYVGGLLRVHLRLASLYADGRRFYATVATSPPVDCNYIFAAMAPYGLPTSFTPHVRYYSFRMTSPTHWTYWDDEHDVPFTCPYCQGDVPANAPLVFFYGTIDGGIARIHTTPLPPTREVTACTVNCFDNVLFLPGIEASRLYGADGSRLWEPHNDADAMELVMNTDGTSVRPDIVARDVIDNAYMPIKGNVYESFIEDMNALKASGTINDWNVVPYDWRLSLDDLLASGAQTSEGISYLTATTSPYIIQELRRLAATSKSGKVTVIAHSNGGLLAKALMQSLGPQEAARLVDKVILVASPQIGTPSGVAGLLHGYGQGFPTDKVHYALSPVAARAAGDTMPGFYALIPSAAYFTSVDDPVAAFATSSLSGWAAQYGEAIHSWDAARAFLADSAGTRPQPAVADLHNPTTRDDSFLAHAQTIHASLDAWTPPAGVQVIEIAGWGIPTTVSGIDYAQTLHDGALTVAPFPRFTIDGDGTVVTPSALWMNTSVGSTTRYWVDLKKYNTEHKFSTGFGLFPFNHGNIFETSTIRNFVTDLVSGSQKPLSDYGYLFASSPASTGNRLQYSLHSPLTLNLYDEFGRHTGVSTTTGAIDEEIPGTYYAAFGDSKYLFTDASASARIVMEGYGDGTFTFNVDEFAGDTRVASTTFKDMPTTEESIVTIDITSDIATLSPLNIDENGDGSSDFSLVPRPDGVVVFDTIAPTTTMSATGTRGANGWYTSDVSIAFDATDEGSGVKAIYLSIDGSMTTATTTTITAEGVHSVVYYAEDMFGNAEEPHRATVKIDTTPPEAKIAFNPTTRILDFIGIDNLSSTTVATTATSSLISDEAGHTLLIRFTPRKPKARRIGVALSSLQYNSGTTTPIGGSLKYEWNTHKKTGAYAMFAAFIRTAEKMVEAHYRPKKDQTVIMHIPRDLNDADDDAADMRPTKERLPGMVVPYMISERGNLIPEY